MLSARRIEYRKSGTPHRTDCIYVQATFRLHLLKKKRIFTNYPDDCNVNNNTYVVT